MPTGLASHQNIDGVFTETARAIFEKIRPTILLVGEWDERFAHIAALFQWCEHKRAVPPALGADVALVVTNSGSHLKKVLARAQPYTAVLVYDEQAVIPLALRTSSELLLVAYLNSVSERFIRGHVRTLLQLQKHFIAVEQGAPVIVTQEGARRTIEALFQALDTARSADINCDHVTTFFACFCAFAELTSYASPVLVSSPGMFAKVVKRGDRTLVLHCRKKSDRSAYQGLNLRGRAVVYLHDYRHAEVRSLDLTGIGRKRADYYLAAYFLSMRNNLVDPEHQTRFIQPGDIDRVMTDFPEPADFCARVDALLDGQELRFRNIAPKVTNVDFCAQSLAELMGRFEKAVYGELFAQCDNALDTAQMVSGIPQSTLHAKK